MHAVAKIDVISRGGSPFVLSRGLVAEAFDSTHLVEPEAIPLFWMVQPGIAKVGWLNGHFESFPRSMLARGATQLLMGYQKLLTATSGEEDCGFTCHDLYHTDSRDCLREPFPTISPYRYRRCQPWCSQYLSGCDTVHHFSEDRSIVERYCNRTFADA